MTQPLIELTNVSKSFLIPSVRRETVREHLLGLFQPRQFERLQVLDAISFEVQQGETLGIMGRNGSGKSTLLKILSGIYAPDRGRVSVTAPVTPILELGLGWNPELDAIDNVCLMGTVMGLSLTDVRRHMAEILAFAEVERFAHLQLKHFSTGMSARLAYAVAFKAVREVLVLDEIFAVGDAAFKRRCEERYRQLHALGHTTIIVSHDPRTIGSYCTRALLLERGQIVFAGPPNEVAAQYLSVLGAQPSLVVQS